VVSGDLVAKEASEIALLALRDRLVESDQKRELAESALRVELEKKQAIKKAVITEVGQLTGQLGEARSFLQKKEEELRDALSETSRLKEDLEKERKRADDLAKARGNHEELEKALRGLEAERDAGRKSVRQVEEARDAARRDVQQAKSDLAKLKQSSEAELTDLRKKVAAAQTLKGSGEELKELKVRFEEARRRMEKERAEFLEKVSILQSEGDKKEQRIRELQLLIKTLGERLNDLTSRHH
jgi:chromosome segregation ATPase